MTQSYHLLIRKITQRACEVEESGDWNQVGKGKGLGEEW